MTRAKRVVVLALGDRVEDVRPLPAGKQHGSHSRGVIVAIFPDDIAKVEWERGGRSSFRPFTLLRRVDS